MLLLDIRLQTFLVIVASFMMETVEMKEPTVRVYPPNVAVAYNTGMYQFFLGCEVTDLPANTYIEWNYYPTWHPNGITIYSTQNNINNDPTNFTVDPLPTVRRTSNLNLVIKTVEVELATQYECNLTPMIPGYGKSTKVVAGSVICSNVDVYDEGDEVNISCSVDYCDSTKTYSPRITWNKNGKMVPGVVHVYKSSTRNTAIMPKNMTAADDNQEFTCIVDFVNANLTHNSRQRHCSTVLSVYHAVSNITFNPPSSAEAPTNVAVGYVVDCVANGRPAPRIEWYDSRWNLVSGWRKLVVTSAMRSWEQPITVHCRATSYSYRKVKMARVEGTYVFNAVDAAPTAQKGGEAWVIAVSVIVPIVVIAAIAIATFFIIRHREMKKKSTTNTAKGSTAALLFNY